MSQEEKKIFLLDAMALIYRAHFAFSRNPRVNSKGLNTGPMLGFTNSLLEIINKENPSHIAVAFDTSAPTFRHERYEEYKAQREKQPEDIQIAIPIIKDIIKAFNIPILEKDGYEADDIIGTLAKQEAQKGYKVYMMTPDKDYAQLVDDNILLYKPAYMGNAVDVLGTEEVLKKFDIDNVDQVRDILGLQGDASDNIPGIPGIGAKTAVKLLKQFGSVEHIVENSDQLKGKQRENIEAYGQQGILSKELATILTDIPIDIDDSDFEYRGYDEGALKKIFEDLEFRTLSKRLFGEDQSTGSNQGQLSLFSASTDNKEVDVDEEQSKEKSNIFNTFHEYHLIEGDDMINSLVKHLEVQEEFCFDTETTSVVARDAELVGLAFSYRKGEAYYVPVPEDKKKTQKIVDAFKAVFENDKIKKIGQNLKYDIMVLKNYDIEVRGQLFDTMLAHYLHDPETRHSMDVIAENFLNYSPVSIETLIGKKGNKQGNMRDVDPEKVVEYAGEDADITFQLKEKFEPIIKEDNIEKLFYEVEVPLSCVLADMEYEGVRIDTDVLSVMSRELQDAAYKVRKEIYEIAGTEFNIASPKQLGEVLFDKMKISDKPKKTKSGQYATGEDILSKMANEHEIARKILDFREYQKLKSTYVDALPKLLSKKDNRLHTDYRQTIAATGRLSSNNPNLQNIPIRTEKGREIRKAFIPKSDEYLMLSADYSQIELRIMAAFSKDESMMEAFKAGKDIHANTASKVFNVEQDNVDPRLRRKAKEVNFGIIYGISAFGLSQNLGISRSEAAEIIDAYFNEFPKVKQYMDEVINKARENQYVTTILGRRRYLRDINSRNATLRGYAERNAINAPIQGSAADIIKIAMINIHQWLKKEQLKSSMIMQVHDELIFNVHKKEADKVKPKVIELMVNALPLEVPMEVEAGIGNNWLEAH